MSAALMLVTGYYRTSLIVQKLWCSKPYSVRSPINILGNPQMWKVPEFSDRQAVLYVRPISLSISKNGIWHVVNGIAWMWYNTSNKSWSEEMRATFQYVDENGFAKTNEEIKEFFV